MLRQIVHNILTNPRVFDLQEKLCNDYTNVRRAFDSYLTCEGKDIIEIGCSTGQCASQVVDMEKNKYVGIDIDEKYIEWAKKKHPHGTFVSHDARTLLYANDSFDIAMFNGVLHHMDDGLARDCLREVSRVLRPTGYLLVSEPTIREDWPISAWFLRNDRGKFIRAREQYRALLSGFNVAEEKIFTLSLHQFCGFAAQRAA